MIGVCVQLLAGCKWFRWVGMVGDWIPTSNLFGLPLCHTHLLYMTASMSRIGEYPSINLTNHLFLHTILQSLAPDSGE